MRYFYIEAAGYIDFKYIIQNIVYRMEDDITIQSMIQQVMDQLNEWVTSEFDGYGIDLGIIVAECSKNDFNRCCHFCVKGWDLKKYKPHDVIHEERFQARYNC